jgi:hypothetical protein
MEVPKIILNPQTLGGVIGGFIIGYFFAKIKGKIFRLVFIVAIIGILLYLFNKFPAIK